MRDLREFFGERARVRWEEPATPRSTDLQYQTVLCRYGHIYQYGDGCLGFATDRRRRIAAQVAALPGAWMEQDGDDGQNVVFPEGLAHEVGEMVGVRLKRRVPQHVRDASAARMRAYHQSKANP